MYPLVPLCVIGLLRKDLFAAVHVLPFTIIGMCISLYHYLLQISPVLGNRATCQSVVPCQVPEFQWFGWITPPLLAFAAFLLITVVLCVKEKR
jgi:disulfide bond formation protein DsbB